MTEIQSLVFYLLIFALSAGIVGLGVARRSRVIKSIGLLLPILVSSFRVGIGTDYNAYVSIYNTYSTASIGDFISDTRNGTEIGYFLVNKLSYVLFDSPFMVFAVMAFITVVAFYVGLSRLGVRNTALAYFLYLLVVFPVSLNVVRQAAAASIVVFALPFLLKRQYVKYSLLVLLASTIHTSALIMLALVLIRPFYRHKKEERAWSFPVRSLIFLGILITATPLLLSLSGGLDIFSRYSIYADAGDIGANISLLINILILAAICLFARRSIGRSEVYRLLFLLALANIVFMAVPESGQILKRLSVFLSFAPIVILAGMTDMFKGAKTKVVMRILLICYGVLFFVFSYYILGQAEIIPYQSIWGEA